MGEGSSNNWGVVDHMAGGVGGNVLLDRDLVDMVVDIVAELVDNRGGSNSNWGSMSIGSNSRGSGDNRGSMSISSNSGSSSNGSNSGCMSNSGDSGSSIGGSSGSSNSVSSNNTS